MWVTSVQQAGGGTNVLPRAVAVPRLSVTRGGRREKRDTVGVVVVMTPVSINASPHYNFPRPQRSLAEFLRQFLLSVS
ncbi:hypothetical protein E2C01_036969 [Portunus trituberculatus]|uniref:Uncharacterized protein n=1 Tax=Portunus trituberculatus TaxID=210409 RepID=A0A5B7FCV1_PORTR|nr:hypothetical protein [Portunus trituberculatus]